MEVSTKIETKNNIRKHKVVGFLDKSLMIEMLKAIYSNSNFQPDMNSYWDFSRADMTSFSVEDTEEVANFVKEHRKPTYQYKSALLAPEDFTYLLTSIFAEHFSDQGSGNVQVFKEEEEAFRWLGVWEV